MDEKINEEAKRIDPVKKFGKGAEHSRKKYLSQYLKTVFQALYSNTHSF